MNKLTEPKTFSSKKDIFLHIEYRRLIKNK